MRVDTDICQQYADRIYRRLATQQSADFVTERVEVLRCEFIPVVHWDGTKVGEPHSIGLYILMRHDGGVVLSEGITEPDAVAIIHGHATRLAIEPRVCIVDDPADIMQILLRNAWGRCRGMAAQGDGYCLSLPPAVSRTLCASSGRVLGREE